MTRQFIRRIGDCSILGYEAFLYEENGEGFIKCDRYEWAEKGEKRFESLEAANAWLKGIEDRYGVGILVLARVLAELGAPGFELPKELRS